MAKLTHNIVILDHKMSKNEKDALNIITMCDSDISIIGLSCTGISIFSAIRYKLKTLAVKYQLKRYGVTVNTELGREFECYHLKSINKWFYRIDTSSDELLPTLIKIINNHTKLFHLGNDDFRHMTIISRSIDCKIGRCIDWSTPKFEVIRYLVPQTRSNRRIISNDSKLRTVNAMNYIARKYGISVETLMSTINTICPTFTQNTNMDLEI